MKACGDQILLTHRRQFHWIHNIKFKHVIVYTFHLPFKGYVVNKFWRLFQKSWFFFEMKYIVQSENVGHAHLWLTLHFRVAGSHASESDFLLTCPTPTRNHQLIHASEMHGSVVYMVFRGNKFVYIGEQGNGHWCLSVFELIRQIITHKDQSWQIIGASIRFGRHRKRWQNMSAYLTNEISYRRKKLVMHLNW